MANGGDGGTGGSEPRRLPWEGRWDVPAAGDQSAATSPSAPDPAPASPPPPSAAWSGVETDTAWTPPAPPRSRTGPWAIVLALVLVVALVAGGLVAWSGRDGKDYPDDWDARVAPLVGFVEDERGLDFEHPVEVEYLTEREFRERVKSDESDLTEEDREDLQSGVGLLRALGLVEGDLDLLDAMNELQGDLVLAFYDPDDEKIVVRGTQLTPAQRVTVVHELMHALQDQHFDLDDMLDSDIDDSVIRGLVEGDATVVEDAYVETLSRSERDDYERETAEGTEASDAGDIPAVLNILFSEPYAFGPALVRAIRADGGTRALDRAFQLPPDSEAQLVAPLRYLEHDRARDVDAPDPPDGAERVDDGDFGMFGWYVVLAERIDPYRALDAVDGWAGDQFVQYREDGRICVAIAYRGETGSDTDRMEAAVDEWANGLPSGMVGVERHGDELEVQSCDPGADAKVTTGRIEEAVVLPVARSQAFGSFLQQDGVTPEGAWCLADEIITGLTLEELGSDELPDDFEARVRQVAVACASSLRE
jgi:hypothetical protein